MSGRERNDCRVSIVYSKPTVGTSYFTAECRCGWFGTAHARRRPAEREALTHASVVVPLDEEPRPPRGFGRSIGLLRWTGSRGGRDEATAG